LLESSVKHHDQSAIRLVGLIGSFVEAGVGAPADPESEIRKGAKCEETYFALFTKGVVGQ